jgi:hypothetical protein
LRIETDLYAKNSTAVLAYPTWSRHVAVVENPARQTQSDEYDVRRAMVSMHAIKLPAINGGVTHLQQMAGRLLPDLPTA